MNIKISSQRMTNFKPTPILQASSGVMGGGESSKILFWVRIRAAALKAHLRNQAKVALLAEGTAQSNPRSPVRYSGTLTKFNT